MCKNATATAASLMTAIEPTLKNLLTLTGVASTPAGEAAIAAFDAAQKAVAAWTPGTTAQMVVEGIDAFTEVFDVLPIPEDAKALANIISAGVVTVIGVLTANAPITSPGSPGTAVSEPRATVEETTALHQAKVVHETTVKVQELVPEFKRSLFTAAAHQYKNAWDKTVAASDPKYASLAA